MKVTEGISGLWHYHLRRDGVTTALCGATVMPTEIKVSDWGVPFGKHFPKRPTWCKKCEQINAERAK
mgnify:CR=1 FL=1